LAFIVYSLVVYAYFPITTPIYLVMVFT